MVYSKLSPLFIYSSFTVPNISLPAYKEVDLEINVDVPAGYSIFALREFDVEAMDSVSISQIRLYSSSHIINIGLMNTTSYNQTKWLFICLIYIRSEFVQFLNS